MSDPRVTGRQLTTTAVALCATAVLAPVGVLAATGQEVNIVDPVVAAQKAPGKPVTPFSRKFFDILGEGVQAVFVDYTVPADKTLVVESVTVQAGLPTGEYPAMSFIANQGHPTEELSHHISFDKGGTFTVLDQFVGTHAVRWDIAPGRTIRFQSSRTASTGTGNTQGTLSGYLI